MSQCCMRNCYGTSVDDVVSATKQTLPSEILKFLLDLGKCVNNRYRSNGLANFNMLNIFAAQKLIQKLRQMDRDGDRYDLSTSTSVINKDLASLLEEFDRLNCAGYGYELNYLDDKYNGADGNYGMLFPPGLSDDDKNKIIDSLKNNNNYNDFKYGNESGTTTNLIPIKVGSSDSDKSYDDLFDNTGNPLTNIPTSALEDISLTQRKYICFEPVFQLENYLFGSAKEKPLVTASKVENLKKIHNDILLPIYNHYYGDVSNPSCQIKIIFALGSLKNTIANIGGSSFSRHLRGEAVDFTMTGVDSNKLIEDIKSGVLKLNFGVLAAVNGIHITLPYTFEDLDVRGIILKSPKKSLNSLTVDFIF